MRVLHILNALYQGGAERQLELIIDETPSTEHIVISLQSINTPLSIRLKKKGVTVLFLNFRYWSVFLLPLKLRMILSKYESDDTVIQCWMYHGNFFGWLASIGMNIPVFWNIRRTEVPSGLTGILSKLCAKISRYNNITIFCNSKSGELSHTSVGYNPNNFVYIPNAIEPVSLENKEKGSDFLICCIGRYSKIKGYEVLLESAGAIKEELFKNKVKFIIVGRDVEMQRSIKLLIDNYNLGNLFDFRGELDNVYEVLRDANLFCLPSLSEGFPNVLLEAMMAGLPCIATNVGDVVSILGASDMVVQPAEKAELSQKILHVLKMPKVELEEYGNRNRDIVLKKYSVEITWSLYHKAYIKELSNRNIHYKV
ncbi:MAG: glycosyltransferase involved in cell wall biosynthesis [Oceanicoccus sp.]